MFGVTAVSRLAFRVWGRGDVKKGAHAKKSKTPGNINKNMGGLLFIIDFGIYILYNIFSQWLALKFTIIKSVSDGKGEI